MNLRALTTALLLLGLPPAAAAASEETIELCTRPETEDGAFVVEPHPAAERDQMLTSAVTEAKEEGDKAQVYGEVGILNAECQLIDPDTKENVLATYCTMHSSSDMVRTNHPVVEDKLKSIQADKAKGLSVHFVGDRVMVDGKNGVLVLDEKEGCKFLELMSMCHRKQGSEGAWTHEYDADGKQESLAAEGEAVQYPGDTVNVNGASGFLSEQCELRDKDDAPVYFSYCKRQDSTSPFESASIVIEDKVEDLKSESAKGTDIKYFGDEVRVHGLSGVLNAQCEIRSPDDSPIYFPYCQRQDSRGPFESASVVIEEKVKFFNQAQAQGTEIKYAGDSATVYDMTGNLNADCELRGTDGAPVYFPFCERQDSTGPFESSSIIIEEKVIFFEQAKTKGTEIKYSGDSATVSDMTGNLNANCELTSSSDGGRLYFAYCYRKGGSTAAFQKALVVIEDKDTDLKQDAADGKEIKYSGDQASVSDMSGVLDAACELHDSKTGGSYGDPHIKTWGGNVFDFHGECDLVLLQNPDFAGGLGMELHIRTKIRTWWSYIESAVLRIGDHTLEVTGGQKTVQYRLDGAASEEVETQSEESFLGDYVLHFNRINQHQGRVRVDVGTAGDAISFETFRDFVRVNVHERSSTSKSFVGAVGLMGTYPQGIRHTRDKLSVLTDDNQFGQEWQVLASEQTLFHSMKGPQHPMKCAMPSTTTNKARRLGESLITLEDAARACARVSPEDQATCIFDVLATNDKDMAGSY